MAKRACPSIFDIRLLATLTRQGIVSVGSTVHRPVSMVTVEVGFLQRRCLDDGALGYGEIGLFGEVSRLRVGFS